MSRAGPLIRTPSIETPGVVLGVTIASGEMIWIGARRTREPPLSRSARTPTTTRAVPSKTTGRRQDPAPRLSMGSPRDLEAQVVGEVHSASGLPARIAGLYGSGACGDASLLLDQEVKAALRWQRDLVAEAQLDSVPAGEAEERSNHLASMFE